MLPDIPVQTVLLDGFDGTPNLSNVEVAADIELAISMAPGLSSVVSFEGENADTVFAAMASPPSGTPLCNQLSSSWAAGVDDEIN